MVLAGTVKGGIVVPDDPSKLKEGQRIKLIPQESKKTAELDPELEKELARRTRRARARKGQLKSHKDVMALVRNVKK